MKQESKSAISDQSIEKLGKVRSSRIILKIVVLNVINLLLIGSIFLIIGKLPALGNKLKELRSASFVAQGENDAAVLRSELERHSEDINKLKSLYVNASGFSDFIGELTDMKESGQLSDFTIVGSGVITNNAKQKGVPLMVTFEGTEAELNESLEKLYSSPVLFNLASVELERNADNTKMGLSIFLLVDESFAKN